jgi:hypothetical protein
MNTRRLVSDSRNRWTSKPESAPLTRWHCWSTSWTDKAKSLHKALNQRSTVSSSSSLREVELFSFGVALDFSNESDFILQLGITVGSIPSQHFEGLRQSIRPKHALLRCDLRAEAIQK